jgi:hypothetical protein
MRRYFCRACVWYDHAMCLYVPETGEDRTHCGRWCRCFKAMDKHKKLGRAGLIRTTEEFERMDKMIQVDTMEKAEIDAVIITKAANNKDRTSGTKEHFRDAEKARVVEVAREHTGKIAAEYFGLTEPVVSRWKKELEAREDPIVKEFAARTAEPEEEPEPEEPPYFKRLTREDVPVVPKDAKEKPEQTLSGYYEELMERQRALMAELDAVNWAIRHVSTYMGE